MEYARKGIKHEYATKRKISLLNIPQVIISHTEIFIHVPKCLKCLVSFNSCKKPYEIGTILQMRKLGFMPMSNSKQRSQSRTNCMIPSMVFSLSFVLTLRLVLGALTLCR